jgi:hypothetical protein
MHERRTNCAPDAMHSNPDLAPSDQVPLLVGTATAKAILALKDTRHDDINLEGNGDSAGQEDAAQPKQQEVTLQWQNISCQLDTKSGDTKQLLSITGSSARPGRWASVFTACRQLVVM